MVRGATEENLSDFPEGLEHLLSTGPILDTGTQAVSKMEASFYFVESMRSLREKRAGQEGQGRVSGHSIDEGGCILRGLMGRWHLSTKLKVEGS